MPTAPGEPRLARSGGGYLRLQFQKTRSRQIDLPASWVFGTVQQNRMAVLHSRSCLDICDRAFPQFAEKRERALQQLRCLFLCGGIDRGLCQLGQGVVGLGFFRKRCIQELDGFRVAELLGPGTKRAVAADLVVLDRLG